MKITKVINNSFIYAHDKDDKEVIVMGKGIGFKAKPGDVIDKNKISKVFVMNNKSNTDKFKQLLENLPLEHFELSHEIINYTKRTLGKKLNQNIYITLTDHINFAIERFEKGLVFQNPLLWEVKQFYKSEYLIGEYAIRLIKDTLGIEMNEDEAANIALHIVNAEYNTNMNEALKITTLISDIVNIISNFYNIKLDEESLSYSRLVTHLKFLSQRIFLNEMLEDTDEFLIEMIKKRYKREYECSLIIKDYIAEKYNHQVSNEELSYLTVHIKRVSMYEDQDNFIKTEE